MDIKFCPVCERNVAPRKKFSWLAFLLWALAFGIGGIGYIVYYIWFKQPECPTCKGQAFLPPKDQ